MSKKTSGIWMPLDSTGDNFYLMTEDTLNQECMADRKQAKHDRTIYYVCFAIFVFGFGAAVTAAVLNFDIGRISDGIIQLLCALSDLGYICWLGYWKDSRQALRRERRFSRNLLRRIMRDKKKAEQ